MTVADKSLMSPFTREFLFYLAELRRYEQCQPKACSDTTAYWLWFRVRSDAVLLIGESCISAGNVPVCGGLACSCAPGESAGGAPLAGTPALEPGCVSQSFPDPAFSQAGVVAPPDSPDFGKRLDQEADDLRSYHEERCLESQLMSGPV
jgi:hypothetical protein